MEWHEKLAQALRECVPGLELRADEPMADHTTFRIGGPVKLMALPKSEAEAEAVVKTAASMGIVPFFLGNGSNLLVADKGVDGFIVKPAGELAQVTAEGNCLIAGGGIRLSALANFARDRGLSGLEFAHGIRGSLGGAISMNAGAYGGEISQVVSETVCLNAQGERENVSGAAHGFGYRKSAFSDGRRFILRAKLCLKPSEPDKVEALMETLALRRRAAQPLDQPSAGSVFKRPEGYFAGSLIDVCGLKGVSVGGARVSPRHAGFIVNQGDATCEDVCRLVAHVQETVLRETGVALEMEIKTLGLP